MRYFTLILFLFSCLLVGCKKPEKNPELKDPLYGELLSEAKSYEGKATSAQKQMEEQYKRLDEAKPQTGATRRIQAQISVHRKNMMAAKQMSLYYSIKAKRRKTYIRKRYLAAFKRGEVWPDKEKLNKEVERYRVHREMVNIPRNWSARRPRHRVHMSKEEQLRARMEAQKATQSTGGTH